RKWPGCWWTTAISCGNCRPGARIWKRCSARSMRHRSRRRNRRWPMVNMAEVTRRELRGYFASPVAYLFMAACLGVTLFVFFWVGAFFARNVANVTPLFRWMPLLLIFLVAAITMRGWSEERRSGTLELLLTAPRSGIELVLGKFFG